MAILIELFITFFKIGLFSFGGGYAMLPLIQREVVTVHGWLTAESFINIVGISQATPGPIAINSATYVGYKTAGILGSTFATFGVILPSVIIIYVISRLFMRYKDGIYVQGTLKVIRLGAVGLIAAAAVLLMGDVFTGVWSVIIFLAAFIASFRFNADPILIVVLSGLAGFIIF
ncbi:chromate transporter [Youngiibacter multivorans]|uniref:Chromate transporter n=1 Tax=Youngiibacter multivorans TaxID=937251 RepID=A0ABS4G3X5_9CLOT|nr:chromate transporter [Youngiibacter multivorans]MBP1919241.1 chromate transporter [Youngiibacter multivorans]